MTAEEDEWGFGEDLDEAGLAEVNTQIGVAVQTYVTKADEVKRLEGELKAAKGDMRRIQEETLPALMQKASMSEAKLDNGAKVKLGKGYYPNIPAAKRPQAYAWFEDHGHGGVVRSVMTVDLGTGDISNVQGHLAGAAEELGLEHSTDRKVHAGTLKRVVKEIIESGGSLPADLFTVHVVDEAKVTVPKR